MADDRDPDGFDARGRGDVALRFVALNAQRGRDSLVASLSPLELAQHDLAAMLEFRGQYEAGETSFPGNDSNTAAMNNAIEDLRNRVKSLEE